MLAQKLSAGMMLTLIRITDIINGLRVNAANARVMFNYNPTSTLEAVQRAFPLGSDGGKPAINYVRCQENIGLDYLRCFDCRESTSIVMQTCAHRLPRAGLKLRNHGRLEQGQATSRCLDAP